MRFMFVYHVSKTAGSGRDIYPDVGVAPEVGHEVVIDKSHRKSSTLDTRAPASQE
jgi:hypothetical protein